MISNKIPYAILALQVELLYQKKFPENNLKAIEDHCEYIAQYIESCGYSVAEYMELWMREQNQDN